MGGAASVSYGMAQLSEQGVFCFSVLSIKVERLG
ncbi:protein of unknown function [Georgfuchsia toluolica]|uniref:Uncharacterized protein n=1 Tax=Georgfuchsia toluolica TaxID=424218 RepID=A0A916N2I4_9PROT|nr:protein of unknown function [Georgfuchsia toluolica]